MSATALITPVTRPERVAAERLGAEITELCGYLYAAEYRLLTLLREFDEKACYVEVGFHSTAHWLNFHCGIGLNAAREKLRVAKALAELPKISAAFERGALSYSKVRAMTRVADAETEAYLLMIATHGTAHHVEKLVAKTRYMQRLQAAKPADPTGEPEAAAGIHAHRELVHYYDEDGYLVIRARLPADEGALVVMALEKAMDVAPMEEPVSARRADALAAVAETCLNHPEAAGTTADRYLVVVHVTAETSSKTPASSPIATAWLDGGFGCEKTVSGEVVFRDRGDTPLPRSAPLSGTVDNGTLQRWLDTWFLEAGIDDQTCMARWYAGERMDWNMAVSAMFPR